MALDVTTTDADAPRAEGVEMDGAAELHRVPATSAAGAPDVEAREPRFGIRISRSLSKTYSGSDVSGAVEL